MQRFELKNIPMDTEGLCTDDAVTLKNCANVLEKNYLYMPEQRPNVDNQLLNTEYSSYLSGWCNKLDQLYYDDYEASNSINFQYNVRRATKTEILNSFIYTLPDQYALRIWGHVENQSIDQEIFSFDGVTELKAVGASLQQNQNHVIRVLKYNNTIIVITNQISWEIIFKLKALQCSLFSEKSKDKNEDVVGIYKALAENDLDTVNNLMNKILNYPLWKDLKLEATRQCFTVSKENKLTRQKRVIESAKEKVSLKERAYCHALVTLQDEMEYYNMLQNTEDNIDINEILDYMKKHPYIKDITPLEDNCIELYIEAPICYYDPEYVQGYRFPNESIEKGMNEVFVKEKYKLWTHCKITFDPSTFHTSIEERIGNNGGPYIRHPHIDRYGCQGNHPDEIQEWVKNYDYIGCIEQIMTMVFNLNWLDGTVINEMFDMLQYEVYSKKIFEDVETHEFVSYDEILNRIRKEETEEY